MVRRTSGGNLRQRNNLGPASDFKFVTLYFALRVATFLLHVAILIVLVGSPWSARCASPRTEAFVGDGRKITYEEFRGVGSAGRTLVLLTGASGPHATFYRRQASYFADHGYRVLLLHYFDATKGFATATESNYRCWSRAVQELIEIQRKQGSSSDIGLLGYSLGASLALIAGSQSTSVAAIIEWYGSLPDIFVAELRRLPPLLILHGAEDTVIPVINARQLQELCVMRGFVCSSHIYEYQQHGFSNGAVADADDRTLKFLMRHLR